MTDPIQLAFYMRGYSSIISWDGYDHYHDDVIQFQRSIGDDTNEHLLTQDELRILFDPKSKLTQMASTLDWLRAVHNYANNYFNSKIDFEYEDEFNLGECKIPTSTGLYFNVKVSVKQNRSATKVLGLNFDKDAPFSLKCTDSSCDFAITGGISESVESTYKSLTDKLTGDLKVDIGQGTISLGYDNGNVTLTIDTLLDKVDINGKISSLTMKTLLEYKITVGFEALLKSTYKGLDKAINTAIDECNAVLHDLGLEVSWSVLSKSVLFKILGLVFIKGVPALKNRLFEDGFSFSKTIDSIYAIFASTIVNCFDEFIKLIEAELNKSA